MVYSAVSVKLRQPSVWLNETFSSWDVKQPRHYDISHPEREAQEWKIFIRCFYRPIIVTVEKKNLAWLDLGHLSWEDFVIYRGIL